MGTDGFPLYRFFSRRSSRLECPQAFLAGQNKISTTAGPYASRGSHPKSFNTEGRVSSQVVNDLHEVGKTVRILFEQEVRFNLRRKLTED